jgi:CO dehydrogenase nickel-insertion accessory protein CooC1
MNARIGILGKGGAGKSTCAVFVARAMAGRGHKVVILDADSTNRGLHLALGIAEMPRSLIEFFGGTVFRGGTVSCPVDDPMPLKQARISLTDLPGDYLGESPESITYLAAGKLGSDGPGAGCDGPLAKIARDLVIGDDTGDCVTLIDLKAGLEDMVRGVITGLDLVVVVVDPTVASLALAQETVAMVKAIKAGELPATRHLESEDLVRVANETYRNARIKHALVLLNRISSNDIEQRLKLRLAEAGITVSGSIPERPEVSARWLEGRRLPESSDIDGIASVVARAEDLLKNER